MISFRSPEKFDKNVSVILISEEQAQKKSICISDSSIKKQYLELITSKQFSGENGESFPVTYKKSLIIFLGIGKARELSLTALRITVRNLLLSRILKTAKTVEIIPHEEKDSVVTSIIEGILLGTYVWRKYITPPKNDHTIHNKTFTIVASPKQIYKNCITVCEGTNLARDLVNDNADTVTSAYMEKVIRSLIKGHKNVSIEVLNKKEMEKKGLGLHLAVNQGSPNEPKLIIVKYNGAANASNYTALIGKGMTYDTGGLNLKPTGSIETMKMDMGGSAAVVGTLKNILELKPKKNVIFACGMAENVTGSKSYKPGDVIVGYAKKTVEVANTDAEGRLVLADAIAYINANYKPKRMIDIATLTGACIVGLGLDYTGLVTPDDSFARQIIRSSNDTDDRVWRLPSYPELKSSVKSNIADIRNLGAPKGSGGAITAAEFLRQFTEDTLWAHLDIAGTSYVEQNSRMYFGYGATGSGVRLLTHYIQNHA